MTGRVRDLALVLALGVVLASGLSFGFVATVDYVHDARPPFVVAVDPQTLSLLSALANVVVFAALLLVGRVARRGPGREGER